MSMPPRGYDRVVHFFEAEKGRAGGLRDCDGRDDDIWRWFSMLVKGKLAA